MRAASHEVTLRQPTAGGALSSLAASLDCCVCLHGSQHSSQAQSRHHSLPFVRSVCSACGAHHAPVTQPATTFAHGRLRASHAVCLRGSTLEPVICARKEGADIESVSTTESILAESLVMQRNLSPTQTVPGLYATSRHCIPRPSPRNSNSEETANNGAAANCSARHGSCYSRSLPSRSVVALSYVRCRSLRATIAATAPASAVAELGVVRRCYAPLVNECTLRHH